jgi:hypothetical protein
VINKDRDQHAAAPEINAADAGWVRHQTPLRKNGAARCDFREDGRKFRRARLERILSVAALGCL